MQGNGLQLSRPTTVLAFMAVLVAAAAWHAPPRHDAARVAVMLPGDTYKLLSLMGGSDVDTMGHPRSVVQVIEEPARK